MRWHLATDNQLQAIFQEDMNCPNYLLVGVVEEMMKRNLFDGMIIKVAKDICGMYDRDEVLQVARIGIYQLAKIYNPSKLSFKQMCFIAIERRIKTILQQKYQKKNHMNQQALMNEVPEITADSNVERIVIQKLTLQEQMAHLTEKQHNIIKLFLEGYSLKWIGENIYNQDTSAIRYQFKDALRRMNIQDYKIGARCGLKGA